MNVHASHKVITWMDSRKGLVLPNLTVLCGNTYDYAFEICRRELLILRLLDSDIDNIIYHSQPIVHGIF